MQPASVEEPGTSPRIIPQKTMDRERNKRKRYAGESGPPAMDPAVNSNWEDTTADGSSSHKNDGHDLNPSGRSSPDRVRAKPSRGCINIGTWNVRTLHKPGKLDNLIQEAKHLDSDIIGVAETRWTGDGYLKKDDYIFIHSGGEEHCRGVGFLIKQSLENSILGYWPLNDRVMLLKINAKHFDIAIIQVYAPTSEHSDEEIEVFYEHVQKAIKQTKSTDVVVIIGDFNAKVGSNHEKVVGKFGLGDCNERGERLIQFCKENQLIVTNTFYEHPMRRRYTWKSPGERYRNQIDFILVRERFRNSVKQARSYPGADIASDHNPVLVKLNVKLKKNKRSTKGQSSGIYVNILKTDIADVYNVTFRNRYEGLNVEIADQSNNVEESVENTWCNFICSLQSANEILPKKKRQAKQPWMTDEILLMMSERRKQKRGSTKYKKLNDKIEKECRVAKEKWLNDKCEEIEELDKRHLTLQLHKKTKNLCGINKCSTKSGVLKERMVQ